MVNHHSGTLSNSPLGRVVARHGGAAGLPAAVNVSRRPPRCSRRSTSGSEPQPAIPSRRGGPDRRLAQGSEAERSIGPGARPPSAENASSFRLIRGSGIVRRKLIRSRSRSVTAETAGSGTRRRPCNQPQRMLAGPARAPVTHFESALGFDVLATHTHALPRWLARRQQRWHSAVSICPEQKLSCQPSASGAVWRNSGDSISSDTARV